MKTIRTTTITSTITGITTITINATDTTTINDHQQHRCFRFSFARQITAVRLAPKGLSGQTFGDCYSGILTGQPAATLMGTWSTCTLCRILDLLVMSNVHTKCTGNTGMHKYHVVHCTTGVNEETRFHVQFTSNSNRHQTFSLSVSRAEVASSRSRIFDQFSGAVHKCEHEKYLTVTVIKPFRSQYQGLK